jgi:hypothetical protein
MRLFLFLLITACSSVLFLQAVAAFLPQCIVYISDQTRQCAAHCGGDVIYPDLPDGWRYFGFADGEGDEACKKATGYSCREANDKGLFNETAICNSLGYPFVGFNPEQANGNFFLEFLIGGAIIVVAVAVIVYKKRRK